MCAFIYFGKQSEKRLTYALVHYIMCTLDNYRGEKYLQ